MKKTNLFLLFILSTFAFSVNAQNPPIEVNTLDDVDDGQCTSLHCSLREAINFVNADIGSNVINFNIPSAPNGGTITLTNTLPNLIDNNTTIDVTGSNANYDPQDIYVDGINVGGTCFNLIGNNTEIYGLGIVHFNKAVNITTNSSGNQIGDSARPNYLIGSLTVPCLTCTGIDIFGDNNIVSSNLIYNMYSGAGAIEMWTNSTGNTIGGDSSWEGNTLLKNNVGVQLNGAIDNYVAYNYIGIFQNIVVNDPLEDNTGISMGNNANTNHIYQNYIAGNGTGINISTTGGFGNHYESNSIYCNTVGINNNGGNNALPAPVVTSVDISNTSTIISGTAIWEDTVQVYIDYLNCDVTCQGEYAIGTAITDINGDWTLTLGYAITDDEVGVTATSSFSYGTGISTSEFSACAYVNRNDECQSAKVMSTVRNVCEYDTYSFYHATPSTNAISGCTPYIDTNPNDIWIKVDKSFSTYDNFMVAIDPDNTTIDPIVEIYKGNCDVLVFERCDTSLITAPHAFAVENITQYDELYLRIFNKDTNDTGRVSINVYEIPNNTADWDLCGNPNSLSYSKFKATEFIVQYEPGTTPAEMQAVATELGLAEVDACMCSPAPFQLFRTDSPLEMEDRKREARQKSKVDTTSYNFILDPDPCVFVDNGVGTYECNINTNSDIFSPNGYYNPSSPDKSVKVAIVDTGVRDDHINLTAALWQNSNAGSNENCVLNDNIGYDFFDFDNNPEDMDGHGTAVSGVLVGNYPSDIDLDIITTKFFEDSEGELFDAICGMHYAINNEVDVMNLSWGFIGKNIPPEPLIIALERARQKDIVVICSAGNRDGLDNDIANKYPANYDANNIISVAAYETNGVGGTPFLADYSNVGQNNVDVAALGNVNTLGIEANDATRQTAGTSVAAPQVARTASVIKALYPMLSAPEIINCITSTTNFDSNLSQIKYGALDHDAALNCAYSTALSKCNGNNVMISGSLATDSLVLSEQIITTDAIITPYTDIANKAGIAVEMIAGFEVEAGAEYLAMIESCNGIILPPFTGSNSSAKINNPSHESKLSKSKKEADIIQFKIKQHLQSIYKKSTTNK